ncbi:MAG: UDP-N-acetylmuramate dehydrogenase, partial [Oscillospiraceae bacterium]
MLRIERLAEQLAALGCVVRREEPMRLHTSFHIGGPAELFCEPSTPEQAAAARVLCRASGIRMQVIGNGSNLLVADEGVRGVVLAFGPSFAAITREGDRLLAQSGATLSQLCRFAQREGLCGLEFAWGIPGSVGGAVFMNAGAYGGEMTGVVDAVWAVDEQDTLRMLSHEEAEFGYRTSRFQREEWLIVGARFRLMPEEPAAIDARMLEIIGKRTAKQPLEFPSAGSTFKRPPGAYAAALIEQCALKGLRVGDAEVSVKHAGFVVNRGHATCAEVLALCEKIRAAVREQTGIELEMEVKRM